MSHVSHLQPQVMDALALLLEDREKFEGALVSNLCGHPNRPSQKAVLQFFSNDLFRFAQEGFLVTSPKEIDEEIDAFAEDAFDSLVSHRPDPVKDVVAATQPPSGERIEFDIEEDSLLEMIDIEEEEVVDIEVAPSAQEEASRPAISPVAATMATLAQQAESNVEVKSNVTRPEPAKVVEKPRAGSIPPSGVSSREFLDLREALNRKDKELLGLRDQISSKERELLDLRDQNLGLERERQDYVEKIDALESQVQQSSGLVKQLESDRATAAKRAEDYKSRAERAEARSGELSKELDGLKELNALELRGLREEHETAIAAEQQRAADQSREFAARLEQEKATLFAAQERAVEQARDAHAADLARRAAQHEEAKNQALSDLARRLNEELDRRLLEAEEQRISEVTAAAAKAESDVLQVRERLEEERAKELALMSEKHSKDFAIVGRKLAEAEGEVEVLLKRISELEDGSREMENTLGEKVRALESTQSKLQTARDRLDEAEKQVAATEAKLAKTTEQLEHFVASNSSQRERAQRARKAMAIGLALLEEGE